ncbi:putative L-type lectin-domain containing receptor kinase S.7 [Bidens hawaiensis]|uniref:putative L-type lectin-domain containing receptor kinase S.7 n=1 Tax=Bidens hawaiensis TaxID=980011 RepID=UPI00404B5224
MSTSNYFLILLFFFTIHFITLTAASNSSFYFKNFTHSPSLDSVLTLSGDATVSTGGSSLQLTAPLPSSSGRVIYNNAVKFYSGNPRKLVSFSTYFSFSISSDSGNGLAFIVFSDDKLKFVSVEFDTSVDNNNNGNDVNGNHIGIDLLKLGLNNGTRLQVWIDYESMSRRLEVRLSKFGENRPLDPILFQHVDLPKIWPQKEGFFVGLSSVNRNSSQVCNVYSWSFKTRRTPDWMHSEPLDPSLLKQEGDKVKVDGKSDCVMRILSALILGIGLGALGSFVGMFLWTILSKRQPVLPEEYAMKPVVVHDKGLPNEKQ